MNETELRLKRLYRERDHSKENKDLEVQKVNPLHFINDIDSFNKFNEFQRVLDFKRIKFKGKSLNKIDKTLEKQIDHIQGLNENWDGEGAKSFTNNTIERTKNIVMNIMNYFIDQQIDFSSPKILPLTDGSLDISWKNEDFRLYINIPGDDNQLIEIYGDVKNHPEDEIDCRFHYEIIEETVIKWLKKTLRYGR